MERFINYAIVVTVSKMKIYLVPVEDAYELHASEHNSSMLSFLDKHIDNMGEGKFKSFLEKYLKKMESREDLTLRTAYGTKELEVFYVDDIQEKEAMKKCKTMSKKYFKKNLFPIIAYGTLCPVTFAVAPFIPVLNWGVAFYFGYKFVSKYRSIKGYQKILNSKFQKGDIKDLESIVKTS